MQLENSFSVPLPVDEAWPVLLDIERIAPCMPGAALDSVSGDDFTGRMKVKLGPINLTYQGKGSITAKDAAARRVVVEARGKDQRGNGTAAAVITATLVPAGEGTQVVVVTDLTITGRPAQFGRGVMTDVGDKLLGQFSEKLAAQLGAAPAPIAALGPVGTAAATATGAVEEIAASVEQLPGEGAPVKAVKKAAAATRKAAAGATEKISEPVAPKAPAKKSEPTKKAAPAKAAPAKAAPAKAAPAKRAAPAAKKAAPAAKKAAPTAAPKAAPAVRPSGPPAGPSGPPARPATGAPVRSVPSAGPRSADRPVAPAHVAPAHVAPAPVAPAPVATPVQPAPLDLLAVSGAGPVARYAPVAGAAAALVAVVLLVRRRRRRRG